MYNSQRSFTCKWIRGIKTHLSSV